MGTAGAEAGASDLAVAADLGAGAEVLVDRDAPAGSADAGGGAADAPAVDGPAVGLVDGASGGLVDGPAVAPPADAAADVVPGMACRAAADCVGSVGGSSRWCSRGGWSCIEGRCAWECRAGRTCTRDGSGCIVCSDEPMPACPEQPCRLIMNRPRRETIESMTCAALPDRTGAKCFGDWLRLADGTLCSIELLATGAYRYVLTCGACQATIVLN